MDNRKVALSAILAVIAAVLGWAAPGLMLIDFGPPLALVIFLVSLPLLLIPFAIGWLTPPLWWIAGVGALGLFLFGLVALLTGPPRTLNELLLSLPLLLPLLLTLSLSFLGRTLRLRSLRKRT